MVETPGRPANLDGVEDNLPGGLRCEEMRLSRPGGERKTLWWFRHIWRCSGEDIKRTTMEAMKSNNSGASPDHKPDDGFAGEKLGQYFGGSFANGSKQRTTSGVSS